jgi:hypothetical protein
MTSPFIVLLEVVDICPLPGQSAFGAEWSGNFARPMPGDRIEWHLLGLVLEVPTYQKQMFGLPPKRGIVASQMDMVTCSIFDSGHMAVVVCTHNDMAQVRMGVEISMQAR